MLSAWDERSAADSIVFTVTSLPKNGRLENVDKPDVALDKFTQIELAAGKIRYVHTGSDRILTDGFEFEVRFLATSKIGSPFEMFIFTICLSTGYRWF